MNKFLQMINKIEETVIEILLFLGVSIIFIGVVFRYLFNHPLAWSNELSVFILTWGIIIGYSTVQNNNEHIKIDILYAGLKSELLKKIMDIFANSIGLIYSVFITFYGAKASFILWNLDKKSLLLNIPYGILYIVLPLTGVMLVLRFSLQILNNIGIFNVKEGEN